MSTKTRRMPMELAGAGHVSQGVHGQADSAGDSLLCALLGVYLASLALEGVVRYALTLAGAPNVLYLRDAIPVATLVALFLRSLSKDDRIDLSIAVPIGILLFHAAYAAMVGVAFFSIAFALKIVMFIPYGMAMWPLVRPRLDLCLKVASVILAVTLVGVFTNSIFGTMPWEGLEYQTAFGTVSTTKMWWTGTEARLPGFARASFDAAAIVGITGVLAMLKFGWLPARLTIAAAALTAIVLTTSKGMVVAFALAALWLIVKNRSPRMSGVGVVGALCAATLAAPFIVVYFNLGESVSLSSIPTVLSSMWERFTDMWPGAFRLLPEGPQALLGAGLGSIGTPQMYGSDPHHFNSADNLALMAMINFGLPGLFYYAIPALALRKVAAAEDATVHQAYVALLLIVYGYGMVSNEIEESFLSIFFGLCFGVAVSAWRRPEQR